MGRDSEQHLDITIHQSSIHAPAWGATVSAGWRYWTMACFNPRARMGRDYIDHLHKGRHQRFNPRARMGRDNIVNR